MIIADIEGTDLLRAGGVPIEQQPRIVEFAAIRLNDETLEEVERHHFLCHPGIPLTPEMTKLTGITPDMVASQPTFARFYPALAKFFLGEWTLVTHNIGYDVGVLAYDLARVQRVHQFPWPPSHVCTVEATAHINFPRKSKEGRATLKELYMHTTGKELDQTHRAMDDVEALCEIVRWLRTQGIV